MGNVVVSKEALTEQELRDFAQQIIQEDVVWRQKVEKDPIGDIVDWLRISGYSITEL